MPICAIATNHTHQLRGSMHKYVLYNKKCHSLPISLSFLSKLKFNAVRGCPVLTAFLGQFPAPVVAAAVVVVLLLRHCQLHRFGANPMGAQCRFGRARMWKRSGRIVVAIAAAAAEKAIGYCCCCRVQQQQTLIEARKAEWHLHILAF